MKCVLLQPSYLPWRGYFHLIQQADVFVFYDDVQYDKHGWRNRNRITGPHGSQWLSIPVMSKGNTEQQLLIQDVQIRNDQKWSRKQWKTIEQTYRKAPFFEQTAAVLSPFFDSPPTQLADLTIDLTRALCAALGITDTKFARSSELGITGDKTERIVSITKHFEADSYLSGPSARDYLDETLFKAAGINVEWMAYDYRPYPQLHEPFDPQLSVIDLMMMTGPDAPQYIWDSSTSK